MSTISEINELELNDGDKHQIDKLEGTCTEVKVVKTGVVGKGKSKGKPWKLTNVIIEDEDGQTAKITTFAPVPQSTVGQRIGFCTGEKDLLEAKQNGEYLNLTANHPPYFIQGEPSRSVSKATPAPTRSSAPVAKKSSDPSEDVKRFRQVVLRAAQVLKACDKTIKGVFGQALTPEQESAKITTLFIYLSQKGYIELLPYDYRVDDVPAKKKPEPQPEPEPEPEPVEEKEVDDSDIPF